MAVVDAAVVEMPENPGSGLMPPFARLLDWMNAEVDGLDDDELDFQDHSPEREWMWWSIRRQVSHMAWTALVFSRRRCAHLLWPDADPPDPIGWQEHRLGPGARWDRELDPDRFRSIPELRDKLDLGLSWLARVVHEQPIEVLRGDVTSVHATEFWVYATGTLARGVEVDPGAPERLRYTLEASLWMVFYEILTHIRTIQRLRVHQGLRPAGALPRVGYLRLPEYWGDTDANGPPLKRIDVG